MSNQRWIAERLDQATLGVRRVGQEKYRAVAVWLDGDGSIDGCTECQGTVTAMSKSCRHALAAKRYLAKERKSS